MYKVSASVDAGQEERMRRVFDDNLGLIFPCISIKTYVVGTR